MMDKCSWCILSAEEKKWLLMQTASWAVYMADEQDYIGHCILVLNRHCGCLSELTDSEWMDLKHLIERLERCFKFVLGAELCNWSLMDCYTSFGAKASKFKNPINDVGVTTVYGLDDPKTLEDGTGLSFVKEHEMTPGALIDTLTGMEKPIFKKVFAGRMAKKLYRMYEYRKA